MSYQTLDHKHSEEEYFCFLLGFTPDGREGGQLCISINDKHDSLDFHIPLFLPVSVTILVNQYCDRQVYMILNVTFHYNIIHSTSAFGGFISHLIRCVRVCFTYKCFMLTPIRLSGKLLEYAYATENLTSSSKILLWMWGSLNKY